MSAWNKGRLVLGAALAAGVFAAVALAQDIGPPPITVSGGATPATAGTPRHPRSVAINARAAITMAGETAPPMPSAVDVWLPKGWHYGGAKLPRCTLTALSLRGPSACPEASIMGRGEIGYRDPNDGDSTFSHRNVTFINGGATEMYLWVVLNNPARVAMAVEGTFTQLDSPRWSSRLHADIPDRLQVVAGISTMLGFINAHIADGGWFTTTHCPHNHRWQARLRLTYASGQVAEIDRSMPCRTWPPRRPLVVP